MWTVIGFCGHRRSSTGQGQGQLQCLLCSRLTGALAPSFPLLGLPLLICEMGMTHHQTPQLSLPLIQATLTGPLLRAGSGAKTDAE